MKNIIFVLISALIIQNSSAQNLYVDKASGNNTNNGTSLVLAWKTIQYAMTKATAGSTIYIKGGTYFENLTLNVSGTAGNSITFTNYSNENVFIDGNNTSGVLLSINSKSNIVIKGLVFQNCLGNNSGGIVVNGSSKNLSFKNNKIQKINWTASLATIPGNSDNSTPFVIYGDNASTAITNIAIDSNELANNITGYSESMSLDGNVNGFTITNNLVHDNGNIGILAAGNYKTSSNPATDHARNGTIKNNTCYRNTASYATSAGIYIDGGKNILVEKNKSYENGNGIEIGAEENGTTDSITVKNNLIFNNQEVGLYVGGYTTSTTGQVLNCIIRNNTLFQNNSLKDGTGEINMSKASNCVFENNVFYTNNQNTFMSVDNISPQTGNKFNYNCWFTPSNNANNITVNWRNQTYNTFASYKTGTSLEANSMYNNPGLTNAVLPAPDLHLLSSSVCIDAGNSGTVISNGETDYEGKGRVIGVKIDIGAFEFNAPLGINNWQSFPENIILYPNPANDFFTIESESMIKEIILFNSLGEKVYSEKSFMQNKVDVNVSSLSSGFYFLNIINESGSIIKKINILK